MMMGHFAPSSQSLRVGQKPRSRIGLTLCLMVGGGKIRPLECFYFDILKTRQAIKISDFENTSMIPCQNYNLGPRPFKLFIIHLENNSIKTG